MIKAIKDYRTLIKHQTKSRASHIEKYQLKALQKLVAYAKQNSPYYQNQLKDLQFETLHAFHAFPSINKNIMMEHFTQINTEGLTKEDVLSYAIEKEKNQDYLGYYKNKFVIGLSSGTSGNKGVFITPKSLTKRLPAVFLARSGLRIKELPFKILFLLRVFSQGFNDINAPFIKLKYLSTMTAPKDIIEAINTHKINILMAPPSLLNQLIPYSKEINVTLKKVITYAEVLTQEDKAKFRKLFNTEVIEIYQASEGQIASPCKKGNLHINEDLVYIELYDKNNKLIQEPNVIGHKMVLTNLVNYAQPLIRYKMNDMIVLDKPCECGSSFRTIKKVLGRHDDILYFYDHNHQLNVVYPDLFARWIITESDTIKEFQVVQEAVGRIHVYIDTMSEFNTDILKRRIQNELSKFNLTANISVMIQPIRLPEDKNKFKRFIRTIDPQ